jgi:aspartate aminotransferase-like enzyme
MGLELYSPDDDSSAVLTAILTPEGVDAVELRLSLRDRHGITVAGGHGDVADRLFRIGHIGYVDVFDITTALAAVELELAEAGAAVERGAGVAAALEAFDAGVPQR